MAEASELAEKAESVVVKVTEIDRAKWTITGKDRGGLQHTFRFRGTTELRRLTPSESIRPLSVFLDDPKSFPVMKDDEILVTWLKEPKSGAKVAIRLTVY
jgi:hypothetical protein